MHGMNALWIKAKCTKQDDCCPNCPEYQMVEGGVQVRESSDPDHVVIITYGQLTEIALAALCADKP